MSLQAPPPLFSYLQRLFIINKCTVYTYKVDAKAHYVNHNCIDSRTCIYVRWFAFSTDFMAEQGRKRVQISVVKIFNNRSFRLLSKFCMIIMNDL